MKAQNAHTRHYALYLRTAAMVACQIMCAAPQRVASATLLGTTLTGWEMLVPLNANPWRLGKVRSAHTRLPASVCDPAAIAAIAVTGPCRSLFEAPKAQRKVGLWRRSHSVCKGRTKFRVHGMMSGASCVRAAHVRDPGHAAAGDAALLLLEALPEAPGRVRRPRVPGPRRIEGCASRSMVEARDLQWMKVNRGVGGVGFLRFAEVLSKPLRASDYP